MAVDSGGFPVSRRLLIGAATAASLVGNAQAQQPTGLTTEVQQGDPDMTPESITYDAKRIETLSGSTMQGTIAARIPKFGEELVKVASEFVGMNRTDNEAEITRFLNLFRIGFRDGPKGSPTAYCAAGVSYVAAIAYQRSAGGKAATVVEPSAIRPMLMEVGIYHFYPTVSVIDMYNGALSTRRFVARSGSPSPGALVIFDWKKNGGADHVGIVESTDAQRLSINTIEFNTTLPGGAGSERDGGQIARRVRAWDATIKGFVDLSAKGIHG